MEERSEELKGGVKPIRIGVVNWSSLSDERVAEGIEVLQEQIDEDFGPVWNIYARLQLLPRLPDGDRSVLWGLILIDSSKQVRQPTDPKPPPGESGRQLGYHDLTNSGKPLAKVYVGLSREEQAKWVHTASHELLEMLADPFLTEVALDRRDASTLRLVAREICDPVAPLGYEVDGVRVSDFVYPAWFRSAIQVPERYHGQFHRSTEAAGLDVNAPFTLTKHGYIAFFDPAICAWGLMLKDNTGKVIVPDPSGDDDLGLIGSRTERRTMPQNRWETSDYEWSP